jgi:ABC-type nitrate/sulfonate/bicarbonate transport system substrate-binding protein
LRTDSDDVDETTARERSLAQLTLGFIPLVDCAPLVVAKEKGFAADEGLSLELVRETSWANIRDRVMVGHFDAAHMLAPMPIASTLGIGHAETPMIAPFSLGLGGNAITFSASVYAEMAAAGARLAMGPAQMGQALAKVVTGRRDRGDAMLTLAVVHPFSGHNYELRYWLAVAEIDPDQEVRIIVLPPASMAAALLERQIDGFWVGEPWNSLAVEAGAGVIAVTKSALWRQGPEKVLGFRADFVQRWPERLSAFLRALYKAAEWAGRTENHRELGRILASPDYLDAPAEIVGRALSGNLVRIFGGAPEPIPDFLVFHDHAANFPWQSHSFWFYSQMVRWGQAAYSLASAEKARQVYRPDLLSRRAGADRDRLAARERQGRRRLEGRHPGRIRNGAMILGPTVSSTACCSIPTSSKPISNPSARKSKAEPNRPKGLFMPGRPVITSRRRPSADP